jgi:hypothetical protein
MNFFPENEIAKTHSSVNEFSSALAQSYFRLARSEHDAKGVRTAKDTPFDMQVHLRRLRRPTDFHLPNLGGLCWG